MDDLGDLSDPVVLTGILTFTTALLSFITCAVLLLCYLLRSVKVDISVFNFLYRVIHNIRPKVKAYCSLNKSQGDFQSLLGAHQM